APPMLRKCPPPPDAAVARLRTTGRHRYRTVRTRWDSGTAGRTPTCTPCGATVGRPPPAGAKQTRHSYGNGPTGPLRITSSARPDPTVVERRPLPCDPAG